MFNDITSQQIRLTVHATHLDNWTSKRFSLQGEFSAKMA